MKKIFILLVCFLLLITSCNFEKAPEQAIIPTWVEIENITPLKDEQLYGYSGLTENEQLVYKYIRQHIRALTPVIGLKKYKLNLQSLEKVFKAYSADHPQDYWKGSKYSYNYDIKTGLIYDITPEYTDGANKDIISQKIEAVNQAAGEILKGIEPAMDEYERALYLHDSLCLRITYDKSLEQEDTFNLYGALVNNSCVCEGYAKAYQFLLGQAGIQSLLCYGKVDGVDHTWNIVRLNGEYFHIDLTSDDAQMDFAPVIHAYFGLDDTQIQNNRLMAETGSQPYPLPVCNNKGPLYFTRYGNKVNTVEQSAVEQIAQAVAADYIAGKSCSEIYFGPITAEDFEQFYLKQYSAIARLAKQKAGVNILGRRTTYFIEKQQNVLYISLLPTQQ